MYSAPANGTEYTLKVFADEDGQTKLYEGKIKYGSEETSDGFKAEDFTLSFDDQGWGGMLKLSCSNANANKIVTFALYDSTGKSMFYDPEFVPYAEGGFVYSAPANGTEYTLKVFADEDGNTLLYKGNIKFTN